MSRSEITAAVAIGFLTLFGCGCGTPQAVHNSARPDTATQAKDNLPGGIEGQGWHIPWRMADPKHPNGPPITVLIADAQDGRMVNQDDDIVIRLWKVRAQLFSEGKPAAIVVAAEITTDQRSKVVIGSGGVTIHSLPGAPGTTRKKYVLPPNTTITADKMTWDIHTDKLIAIGHVHAIQRPPDGKLPTETTGDRMEYNIKTGEIKG